MGPIFCFHSRCSVMRFEQYFWLNLLDKIFLLHFLGTLYRRCDLWRHMFTKEPQSLDFLQAWYLHSSMEENIQSYTMEITLSNSYQLLIWWKGAHLKTCPALTFIALGFMWKLWPKMPTFPYDQCSILPARLAKECTRSHLL